MRRIDIHRPGAMNSSDYTVLALVYVFEDQDAGGNPFLNAEMEPLSARWDELGSPTHSTWKGHKARTCDHCGHSVPFTGAASIVKMLVEDPRGFKIWGTKPESIYDAQKGDLVRFTATVERSNKDASFGVFKRPTKAVNISRATACQ